MRAPSCPWRRSALCCPVERRLIAWCCTFVVLLLTALALFVFSRLVTLLRDFGSSQFLSTTTIDTFFYYLPVLIATAPTAAISFPTLLPVRYGGLEAPRDQLRRIWLSLRLFLVVIGLIFSCAPALVMHLEENGTIRLVSYDGLSMRASSYSSMRSLKSLMPAGITCLCCAILATARSCGRVLGWLGSLSTSADEQQAAAAIAALIGQATSIASARDVPVKAKHGANGGCDSRARGSSPLCECDA